MNISVDRGNWWETKPDLVVLVGDPYSDFRGACPDSVEGKVKELEDGFSAGNLRREVQFSASWDDENSLDCLFFHTSTEKGFTATENLKTFCAKALRLACDTGRKSVAMILRGKQGEGLTEQLVEGSLVGTYSFRDYKKDSTDHYEEMSLTLCLPPLEGPEPAVVIETVAEESASSEGATQEISEAELKEALDEGSDSEEEAKDEDTESKASEDAEAGSDDDEKSEEGAEEENEPESDEEAAAEEEEEAAAEEEEASEPEPEPEPVVEAPGPSPEQIKAAKEADDSALLVGQAFADGVNFARSLVARPACDCTPEFLSRAAKKMSTKYKFSYQAFGPKQLEKHSYMGLVTVGKGADNTPRMIELTYEPETESDVHLVLLGKGVTFDSGGISIKPADKMHFMIGDMAGAAAVLGAMEVIGRLKPSIKVTAIVVSAENKPGAKSYRPGDIIRYKNGTSVHVENTDAEGRLILADGLIRAGELGATHIVDLATLTGACVRALGPSFTGIMGANRKLVNAITRAGGNHGESYWKLPLPLEYRAMLKSNHADINNMGGPYAGATTAGLFLKEFVPPRTPWAHLDIASTFWKQKDWKYYSEGPSGTGVKTIADLALRWEEHLG